MEEPVIASICLLTHFHLTQSSYLILLSNLFISNFRVSCAILFQSVSANIINHRRSRMVSADYFGDVIICVSDVFQEQSVFSTPLVIPFFQTAKLKGNNQIIHGSHRSIPPPPTLLCHFAVSNCELPITH